MTPAFRRTLFMLIVAGLSVGAALAQDTNTQDGRGPARALTAQEREGIANGIVERWTEAAEARRYRLDDWRPELLRNLLRLNDEGLEEAQQAHSYRELIGIVTGKDPDRVLQISGSDSLTPQALGDKSTDLTLKPVNPCRLLDTRIGTGAFAGPLAAGSTTTISTNEISSIVAQGGNAAGCGLPAVDAGALAFTITVTGYAGDAFATVFPATATRPNASTINMGPGTSPAPVANSSVVQQCVSCGTATDISIYLEGASSHVIIDVIGYFDPSPPRIVRNDSFTGAVDPDLTPTICQTADFTPTANETVFVSGTVCLLGAGSMNFTTYPMVSTNGGTTFNFVGSGNFSRAGSTVAGQWACATKFQTMNLNAGTQYRFGMMAGRDSGTADATASRCETSVQRFSR